MSRAIAIASSSLWAGMDVASAELVGADFLSGCGFHQRGPAEEDRARAPHNDRIVAERGNIGAPRRAVAEHDRNLRNTHPRERALVAEDAAGVIAVGEKIRLQRKKAAGAVAQMNHRQAVFDRDIQRAHDLLDRQRIPRAPLNARVVRVQDHLAATDHTDAADLAGAGHFAVVGLVGRQRRQLQKRRARIE